MCIMFSTEASLLRHLPWPRGSNYNSVLYLSVQLVVRKYGKATIVFDGYEDGPSTKDCTHQRRIGIRSCTNCPFWNKHGNDIRETRLFLTLKPTSKSLSTYWQTDCSLLDVPSQTLQQLPIYLLHRQLLLSQEQKKTALVGEDPELSRRTLLPCWSWCRHTICFLWLNQKYVNVQEDFEHQANKTFCGKKCMCEHFVSTCRARLWHNITRLWNRQNSFFEEVWN